MVAKKTKAALQHELDKVERRVDELQLANDRLQQRNRQSIITDDEQSLIIGKAIADLDALYMAEQKTASSVDVSLAVLANVVVAVREEIAAARNVQFVSSEKLGHLMRQLEAWKDR